MAEEEGERLAISPEARECIEATSDCYTVCSETLTHSLGDAGTPAHARHIRLLIDCAEISQTTQNSLVRASELGLMMAAVCVEACEKVAVSCRRIDTSDPQLNTCAEVCDHTANCCRQLAL
jgi:hypothetical protein